MLKEKIQFMIRNGHIPQKGDFISQMHYNELSSEEQRDYIFVACHGYDDYYYKKSTFKNFSSEKIDEMATYAFDEKITKINSNLNIIKNCILTVFILYIFSLIINFCMFFVQ